MYFAVLLINPSDFVALSRTNLIITAVLARIFLKEKLTMAHFVSILITAVGVLFISKPSGVFPEPSSLKDNFNNFTLANFTTIAATTTVKTNIFKIKNQTHQLIIGIILAIFSAFALSCIFLVLKKLNNCKVHWATSTIYVCWLGIPMSLIISVILIELKLAHKNFEKEANDLFMDLCYSILSAFFSILGQVLMNICLKYADATQVSIIFTIGVFVTIILQYFILGILIDLYSGLGALFILFGTSFILIFQIFENKYDKKCKLLDEKESEQPKKAKKCSLLSVIFFKL